MVRHKVPRATLMTLHTLGLRGPGSLPPRLARRQVCSPSSSISASKCCSRARYSVSSSNRRPTRASSADRQDSS